MGLNTEQIYKKNMAALKKHYPQVFEMVQNTELSGRFELRSDKNGINVFDTRTKSFYYDSKNQSIEAYINDEIAKNDTHNARIALLMGYGIGYIIHVYHSNYAEAAHTARYFILEPNRELFKLSLGIVDIARIISMQRINFFVGIPMDELFTKISGQLKLDFKLLSLLRTLKPIIIDDELKRNPDYYKAAMKAFKEAITYSYIGVGNSVEDSLIGVENMLENISEIIENPGINLLYNKFRGKPAIVVSTGPSLNKNKHLLKEVEGKAVIIAADSALKPMLNIGVKPHMITMLERTIGPHKLIKDFTAEEVEDIYLAACPVVNHISYDVWEGDNLIVYRAFDHFKWLGIERGILNIKASSGNMSFKLAEVLGCDPIILVGQDLAYSEDNKTHAKGMVLGEEYHGVTKIYKDLYVKGNYQDQILTNESWFKFLQGYRDDVAAYNGRCINATEGGAFIQGTELMTLREAIDEFVLDQEPLDVLAMMRQTFEKEFSIDESIEDARKFQTIVDQSIDDIQHIIDVCQSGLEYCNEHYKWLREKIKQESINDDDYKKLKEIRDVVFKKKAESKERAYTFQLLFMHIVQSFIVQHEVKLTKVSENVKDTRVAMANQALVSAEYFKVVRDIAGIVLEMVETAKGKVALQLDKYEE
jgi:hypothetical protein